MKISVILTYYNRPRMALQAVDSVRRQTHKDWQLILMDDQSRDIFLVPADPRVEYHVTHTAEDVPRGPARMAMAINEAYRYVEGEAVVYLADDDRLHPDWLMDVVYAFKLNHSVDAVWGRLLYVDAECVPNGDERMPYGWAHPARELDHNQVAHRAKLNDDIPVPKWPTDMERLRRELNTEGPDAGFFFDLWSVTKQWLPLPWATAAFKRVHDKSMLVQGVDRITEERE